MIDVLSYRWKDAYAACRSLNGSQMITIFSEEENDFAANLAKVFTFLLRIYFAANNYRQELLNVLKTSKSNRVLFEFERILTFKFRSRERKDIFFNKIIINI